MEKIPLTKEGFSKLEAELKNLKEIERPSVIEAIATAREHGDLSENAEYSAAREKQSFIEGRILELEDIISRAEVIDVSQMSGDQIRFGATVTLCDEDTEEEAIWQIVGSQESDYKNRKIAMSTPIAKALIGKEEGDSIEVDTPGGSHAYEILKVEYK